MGKPVLHLICNAHLDPVWQWRWEEGCGEALSTFRSALTILREFPELVFNHNEAVLYQWVKQYDPSLFRDIVEMVREGRWHISGGWFLQPDVNMPGTESIIRHIEVGREFFEREFGVRPTVAYNFDSFGHSGGLPQILTKAGYAMYIHMRPGEAELHLPSDLYRWTGADGSEILAYRIAVGLYHTERDNIEQRLVEGTALALRLGRDVPVFWGIGNHGGGPTREDMKRIRAYAARESRVDIIHSTPQQLYSALAPYAADSPVVHGDLQRIFTGCYTSLSRIKRREQQSLGELTQTEGLRTATWWLRGQEYPTVDLHEAWLAHLFNDFHDILPGSCTEPAERDALDLYGYGSVITRRLSIGAAAEFNKGIPWKAYVPVTVLNTVPACPTAPVEAECMLDLRPKWTGKWHLRLVSSSGNEIQCQEEQPDSLLPFNGWRRKISFLASLPRFGVARYDIQIVEGERAELRDAASSIANVDPVTGLVTHLDAGKGRECLVGPLMEPLTIADDGDAWGSGRWSYRSGEEPWHLSGRPVTLASGPVRTITETLLTQGRNRIVMHCITYPQWPVIEYKLRIEWIEARKRLKFRIPTVFSSARPFCEVPGGAVKRPADGQEHVHGRWIVLQGMVKETPTAFAVVSCGLHGFDCLDGEIRLSALRGAAYCHEQGFIIEDRPARRYMDQGVHDVRILVTAGNAPVVLASVAGLADWLAAPPAVYAHLPAGGLDMPGNLLSIEPLSVRLLSLRPSSDGLALLIRMQETVGDSCTAKLHIESPKVEIPVEFSPFEIKVIRVPRNGQWMVTELVEEWTKAQR